MCPYIATGAKSCNAIRAYTGINTIVFENGFYNENRRGGLLFPKKYCQILRLVEVWNATSTELNCIRGGINSDLVHILILMRCILIMQNYILENRTLQRQLIGTTKIRVALYIHYTDVTYNTFVFSY